MRRNQDILAIFTIVATLTYFTCEKEKPTPKEKPVVKKKIERVVKQQPETLDDRIGNSPFKILSAPLDFTTSVANHNELKIDLIYFEEDSDSSNQRLYIMAKGWQPNIYSTSIDEDGIKRKKLAIEEINEDNVTWEKRIYVMENKGSFSKIGIMNLQPGSYNMDDENIFFPNNNDSSYVAYEIIKIEKDVSEPIFELAEKSKYLRGKRTYDPQANSATKLFIKTLVEEYFTKYADIEVVIGKF